MTEATEKKQKVRAARARRVSVVRRHVAQGDAEMSGTDDHPIPTGRIDRISVGRVSGNGYAEPVLQPGAVCADGVCQVNYQIDPEAKRFTYRLNVWVRPQ